MKPNAAEPGRVKSVESECSPVCAAHVPADEVPAPPCGNEIVRFDQAMGLVAVAAAIVEADWLIVATCQREHGECVAIDVRGVDPPVHRRHVGVHRVHAAPQPIGEDLFELGERAHGRFLDTGNGRAGRATKADRDGYCLVVVEQQGRQVCAGRELSGGRFLWTTSNKRGWGSLRLTTIGRKSGGERSVIMGYLEDGPNLISIAMNGWDDGHPSWWLNMEAHPDATVRLTDQLPRPVRARRAAGQERDRLWQHWVAADPRLDVYASRRSTETPVIILEPRDVTT
jgi:deazaflavin-dependent oxidoreductase (nitroreductase family)